MTIQILLKIGAVGILVALLNQILKHSGKEEHAYLLNLAGLIIVLSWVIPYTLDTGNSLDGSSCTEKMSCHRLC